MLLEIFGRFKWMRICVWAGLILSGLFGVASVVIEVVACTAQKQGKIKPKVWSTPISSTCDENASPSFAMAAVNLADDIFLLILPLSAVWTLRLPIRKKICVSAMFLIGFM